MRRLRITLAVLPALLLGSTRQDSGRDGLLAEGSRWETPYFIRDSGKPGPAVLVVGGVHGNEPAGARAAEQIADWSITRGKLIVVPRANLRGLEKNARYLPGVEKELRNLNRNFPRKEGGEARGTLARALWKFVGRTKPDWIIDLHEGYDFGKTGKSVGSSVIASPAARGPAGKMVEAINERITAKKKKFTIRGPPIEGSLARAAADRLGVPSMILETTKKSQSISFRTRRHRILVHRFLTDLEMISTGPHVLVPAERDPKQIRVAVYDSTGSMSSPGPAAFDRDLRSVPDMIVRRINRRDIRDGVLPQFDVLIMPGGSGSKQAKGLGEKGKEEIRKFVRAGGGYYGSCAGAYLATRRYSWSLGILDARTIDSKHWNRGKGDIVIEPTREGRKLLGTSRKRVTIRYANGPILGPAGDGEIPDFIPLAVYRSEIAKKGAPKGVMIGTPAIVAGEYGKGRVWCTSPHPEYVDGLEDFVRRGIRWAAGRD